MKNILQKLLVLQLGLWLVCISSAGQFAQWVNPFIGTDCCETFTLWGNYGGTYPGAVSPWGMVQLSPETSRRPAECGYYYKDTSLLSFSCLAHHSGYPNGSSGRLHFTFAPLVSQQNVGRVSGGRSFSHSEEEAVPGYYALGFPEGDKIEMTATPHNGLFRYTSDAEQTAVTVFDGGKLEKTDSATLQASYMHSIIRFSQPWHSCIIRNDTAYITFRKLPESEGLNVWLSVSSSSFAASRENARGEISAWDFDKVRQQVYACWNEELDCVSVETACKDDKVKFYTALYHSFLFPYIVSDVDDECVKYTGFSPWDTFRSLHPLLSLLKPERQRQMVASLMHDYRAGTALPKGPMSGFHIIPILLDAAVKETAGWDVKQLFEASLALWKSYRSNSFLHDYLENGFVDASQERSVSITSELAYNDWCLARLAVLAGQPDEARLHAVRSLYYRNLLDTETGFLLPRNKDTFLKSAGELGYQESNKWTASYFAPHNVNDLINRIGGKEAFATRLQAAFKEGKIVFDNEPVFHYPYLFIWADRPDLTIQYIRQILENDFRNSPGGLPGNDDLGAMSSWYVLSALGIYPACPGTGEYLVTLPLFEKATIQTDCGKVVIQRQGIDRKGTLPEIYLGRKAISRWFVSHDDLLQAGTLTFSARNKLVDSLSTEFPYSVTAGKPDFRLTALKADSIKIRSGVSAYLPFTVSNRGESGLYIATLKDGEQPIAHKKVCVDSGRSVSDSLLFTCYQTGLHTLMLDDQKLIVEVSDSAVRCVPFACKQIVAPSLLKYGDTLHVELSVQNITGKTYSRRLPIFLDRNLYKYLDVTLQPGQTACYTLQCPSPSKGFHNLCLLGQEHKFKVYNKPSEACLLSLDYGNRNGSLVTDNSGFENHAQGHGTLHWEKYSVETGEQAYLTLPASESLMTTYSQLTLLAWIAPQHPVAGYADFFTKGDYTLLKMEGPEDLVFFAGGWGRGVCQVKVPSDWYGRWHLVAGVCTGESLRLYIDGKLLQEIPVQGKLSATEVNWNIGRNAEMPFSRFSVMKHAYTRIYGAALTSQEIEEIYRSECKQFQF